MNLNVFAYHNVLVNYKVPNCTRYLERGPKFAPRFIRKYFDFFNFQAIEFQFQVNRVLYPPIKLNRIWFSRFEDVR